MSVNALYYLRGILTPAGTLISQITDTTPSSNSEILTGMAAGFALPLFKGIRGQKPDITFTSTSVAAILNLIKAGGSNYCLDLSAGNVDLLYIKGKNLGIREAIGSSVHARLRVARGFLYWTTIAATHQQDATIACRLVACFDGTNNPIVPAGSVAVSGTPTADSFYTLGPVAVNGAPLYDEQGMTLNSGIEAEEAGAAGEIWASYVGVKTISPTMSVDALGQPWRYGITGSTLSAVTAYLRNKAPDSGGNVANTTATHIKFTAANGIILPDSTKAGTNDPAETTLSLELRALNSNSDVLAIDTTSAIT